MSFAALAAIQAATGCYTDHYERLVVSPPSDYDERAGHAVIVCDGFCAPVPHVHHLVAAGRGSMKRPWGEGWRPATWTEVRTFKEVPRCDRHVPESPSANTMKPTWKLLRRQPRTVAA